MYYLRRLVAQVIDAFALVLLGAMVFVGTEYSPIVQRGDWYTYKPSPMYPTGGIMGFWVTRAEHVQDAVAGEELEEGYRLLQFRLFDGAKVSLKFSPDIGWPLVLLYALYYTICTGRWGQTAGKWLMRLKVVRVEGGQVAYLRALGRWVAYYASGLPLYLGLVWIVVDRNNRSWHDRICRTKVVPVKLEGDRA